MNREVRGVTLVLSRINSMIYKMAEQQLRHFIYSYYTCSKLDSDLSYVASISGQLEISSCILKAPHP